MTHAPSLATSHPLSTLQPEVKVIAVSVPDIFQNLKPKSEPPTWDAVEGVFECVDQYF
jgi:hypothetical protein